MYIGATDSTVCPIQAVLSYLKQRSTKPGPLFITGEGKGWTRTMFSSKLKCILHKLKFSQHSYNTHSFQIRAATSASLAQLPDAHIQKLGRWKGCAFKGYIRPPPNSLQCYRNWPPIAYQYSPSTVVSWWYFFVTSLKCVL